jgi:WhiB family redox-sensing transcriptional regulator
VTRRYLPEISDVFKEREASWRVNAACKGATDVFFPERGGDHRRAQMVCASCPVSAECLEFALNTGQKEGVWAGLGVRQLRRLRRERAMLRVAS